jgi:hypothetical protein
VALWWIVHEDDGKPSVFVQEASSLVHARMKANLAGHGGEFSQAHQLDEKTAKKMPKDLVGRVLNQKEAMRLLKRLG